MKPRKAEVCNRPVDESQFRALIENAHDGIALYDKAGRINYVSQTTLRMTGFKQNELLGKKAISFLHPDDVKAMRNGFKDIIAEPGKSLSLFQRIRHKKGHYRHYETRLTNFLHKPEIAGIVSNFRDITEQRQAEDNNVQSQEVLELVMRNVSEGIFMGIVGKEFVYANDAFLKMMGYTSFASLRKIKPADIFDTAEQSARVRKALKKNTALKNEEIVLKRRNGQTFLVSMTVSMIAHEGRQGHFVGTVRDISHEKADAQRLIDSRNFLNNIIETVAAPIFVKDQRHRWIMMNEKFSQLIGKRREDLLGKTDKDVLPANEARVFWKMDNAVLNSKTPLVNEETITSANGQVHDLLTIKSCYHNEHGERFIIGFITDVTSLRRAEAELKKLHASLRAILESTKESIFAVDSKGNYTAFNKHHHHAMKRLYQVDIQIGGNKMRYLKGHPDGKWIGEEMRRALQGEHFVSEHYQDLRGYKGYMLLTYNPILNDSGEVTGVAVFIRDITERWRFEEIIKAMNANLRAVMESTADRILAVDKNYKYLMFNQSYASRVQRHTGRILQIGDNFMEIMPHDMALSAKQLMTRAMKGEQFTEETRLVSGAVFETSYNPIRNEKGQVAGVALFVRDVTEKRKIEEQLKKLNDELSMQNVQLAAQEEELKATLEELSERNFELDQLMYKTSHDLRSPLSSVMGLINLAHLDNDASNYPEYFNKIEGRIKKLDEFISSMLNYARVNRTELQAEEIKLEHVVTTCIRELEYLDNFSRIRTDIEINNHTVPFYSDKLRVDIIFSNIISNAYKYYNPEAESYLKIRITLHTDRANIMLEDNGIGIRAEHQDKIFNMFYRATDRSQGSGLGMYIVKQAVEKLRGIITVTSKFGKGTRIDITLPNNTPS